MGTTGCGCFSFILLIIIISLVFKIKNTFREEDKMQETSITSLRELVDMREKLKEHPLCLELKGRISCENPLRTPLAGIECVFYDFTVTQYWTTGRGDDEEDRNEVVHKKMEVCDFTLSDGTETVPVSINKSLSVDVRTEYEREFDSIQEIKDIPVKYKELPGDATHVSYEYLENYLPVSRSIYFIGDVQFEKDRFILKPGWMNSFITDKSKKTLIHAVRVKRASKIKWLFFTFACFVLAFIGLYGQPEGLADILRTVMDYIIEGFLES
jgi:hypothetical protein